MFDFNPVAVDLFVYKLIKQPELYFVYYILTRSYHRFDHACTANKKKSSLGDSGNMFVIAKVTSSLL